MEMKKTLLKTLSWKAVGAVEMMAVGWFTTGSVKTALGLAAASTLVKGGMFFGHEMIWEKAWAYSHA